MFFSPGRHLIQRSLLRRLAAPTARHFHSSRTQLNASPVGGLRIRREPWREPASAQQRPVPRNVVPIQLGNITFRAHPILLRDLCACPRCLDPSTKQKHFSTADIPADIRFQRWDHISDDEIEFRWTNDIPGYDDTHNTVLSKENLKRFLTVGAPTPEPGPIPRTLWDAQMYENETSDFDFESYMKDDSVLLKAIRQLHTHGLLFVTGVPEDEKSVETVASRIGPLKTTFYGHTWDVRSVPDAINVAYTSQNLGFHMDLMYMKQPPHLQLLHCIRSSAAGGASLFTDSFRSVVDLAEEDLYAMHQLTIKNVHFHYDHPGAHFYEQWRPVIKQKLLRQGSWRAQSWYDHLNAQRAGNWSPDNIKPIDFIESVAWAPPFQGPFSKQTAITNADNILSQSMAEWHPAAQKFNSMIHRPEMIYERMMKPGECVIFDNRRVLHARRAFKVGDAGKERWLKGAYIDKDPYESRLRVLRQTLETARAEDNTQRS